VADPVDPLIGARIDRYQVERKIGAGGMGTVYLARQPEIGARVAIKVVESVDPEEREERSRRLFAEARAVNLIGHESIVNVIDMVRLEDGRPALVMEYLSGVSLDRLIHESGEPLPIAMVTDVVLDVLSAVGAAHRAGILHRDLKPANVFVTPEGRAKVLDFGIAKSVSGATFRRGLQTQAGRVLGTAVYMAPEQARGEKIDERVDLFAVGLILYEAATRRRAIRGPHLGQVLEQHGQPIVAASDYRAEVTPALEAVIDRALQRRPADRYESAPAMAAALRAASAPSPIRASRTELTAALAATGRIELQPLDPAPGPAPGPATPQNIGGATTELPTAPHPSESDDGEPDRAAPAARGGARALLAAAIGAGTAAAVVLLVMRAGADIPLELAAVPAAPPPDAAVASPDAGAPSPGVEVARYAAGRELDAARAAARALLPDAELAGLAVFGGFTDQGIRLERTALRLISPRRQSVGEIPCAVLVEARRGELIARLDRDAGCQTAVALEPPRCSGLKILTEAWLRSGERATEEVVLEYRGRDWLVTADGRDRRIRDRCGERPRREPPRPERPVEPRREPRPSDTVNPFSLE
jgi:serine/threonine-protein kinase